jgi:hypothetical protein
MTSPSRQAQAAVSGVAVSKPTTTRALASVPYFTRKTEVPTFLPLTNQVTSWRPLVVEVILFT